ncbi:hypothetical protein N9L68_05995 [bacterium]|nr:hypothetical protein [bacterium]
MGGGHGAGAARPLRSEYWLAPPRGRALMQHFGVDAWEGRQNHGEAYTHDTIVLRANHNITKMIILIIRIILIIIIISILNDDHSCMKSSNSDNDDCKFLIVGVITNDNNINVTIKMQCNIHLGFALRAQRAAACRRCAKKRARHRDTHVCWSNVSGFPPPGQPPAFRASDS